MIASFRVGPKERKKRMVKSTHDRIIKEASAFADTHEIVVQDISGSRAYKGVYAVPKSLWSPFNDVNKRPVGSKMLWEGSATATEMRDLCRDLKGRNILDQNANETFRSSRSNTGYYDPS
jgi:hypothetical protein